MSNTCNPYATYTSKSDKIPKIRVYVTSLSRVTSLYYIKAAMYDGSVGTKIFSCRIHMHELNNLFLQRDLIYPLFTLIMLLF